MNALICHFCLPCYFVGSGYAYTVSRGSNCSHCALILSFSSEEAKTFLTWTSYRKNSLCKAAAAWARTGYSLSASIHREVEMLLRGWLAWERSGLRICTFRVKELHAHFQDWLAISPWCWLAPARVGSWDFSLSGIPLAASLLPQQTIDFWALIAQGPFQSPRITSSFHSGSLQTGLHQGEQMYSPCGVLWI